MVSDSIVTLTQHDSIMADCLGQKATKPFVGPFLSPKNLNLTLLKLYRQVLLVSAFPVCANGYCCVFQEIYRFSKFFQVLSQISRFSRFETRFVWLSSILLVLSHHTIACSQNLYFLFKVHQACLIKNKKPWGWPPTWGGRGGGKEEEKNENMYVQASHARLLSIVWQDKREA